VLDGSDPELLVLSLPRYEPFTEAVTTLAREGVQFVDIAGNHTIVMTVIAPRAWSDAAELGQVVCEWPILTRQEEKRVAIAVSVERLHEVIPRMEASGVRMDHVYDY
jgi:hypothetical protein